MKKTLVVLVVLVAATFAFIKLRQSADSANSVTSAEGHRLILETTSANTLHFA